MAKYIVQQYIAATRGDCALNAINSMLVVGKVKMIASDFYSGDGYNTKKEVIKAKSMWQRHQGEVSSFVLWQKRPDLWSLELILSGCKMNAGSNGQVARRQTPWQTSHACSFCTFRSWFHLLGRAVVGITLGATSGSILGATTMAVFALFAAGFTF